MTTLKEETFAVSRFLAKSAKVYSREIFQKTSSAKRFFPQNFLKKFVICEYSEKIDFCSYNIKLFVKFQNIRTQETKIVENKFFENLFFSDFNTGQESHLNTVQ